MIQRIFLDLDDTCNTLAMHVLYCAGCKVDPRDYTQHPAQFGYEVHRAANYLLGREKFASNAQFWRTITRTNWAECPTSEIFPWVLHKAARLVGRENVCLATRPTDCPECAAGKLDWIHRVMPAWTHHQYAITPCKHLLARPGALLIDDHEDNIRRFENEGGHGALVPRPWNRLRQCDPFEAIEAQLENLSDSCGFTLSGLGGVDVVCVGAT
jgi:hypothetical protein